MQKKELKLILYLCLWSLPKVDVDGNGTIEFPEFLELMKMKANEVRSHVTILIHPGLQLLTQ